MRNMLEYMLQMNKNESEMIKNVQEMAKTFKDIESQNYGEILNLRDDIREYSKSVEEQMESVGEAQMKVIQAVENLEKDFGSKAISDEEATIIDELMKDYDSQSNADKAYVDWLRENPGKTHPLDSEEHFSGVLAKWEYDPSDSITKSMNPTCVYTKGADE